MQKQGHRQMASNSRPKRGDVWLVDFGEPLGHEQGFRRPAIIVSADPLNESGAGLVIVVPLTTTRRDLPSHIELEPGTSGLPTTSYAKTEDVKSISKERLLKRYGFVDPVALPPLQRALRLILSL